MNPAEWDVAQQMVSSCASSCHKPLRALLPEKLPGRRTVNQGWGSVEWMSETAFSSSSLTVTEAFSLQSVFHALLDKGSAQSPWWAGPGRASSSIMQGMARAITWTGLSLLLRLPNNLIGLKPHTLFLLDTGLVFQMNKPSQAFGCFQLRALTSTTGNHFYMKLSWFFFSFFLIGCSHILSSVLHNAGID